MKPPHAPIGIVHRDADFLVVAKPAGLATTSPDGRRCLVESVAALDPGAPKLHPTSRLDVDVTGIVLFARSARGIEHSLRVRREGRYARLYLGLAARAPEPAEGRWTGAIAVDPRDARLRVVSTHPEARASETDYATAFASDAGALLALRPLTGRTHQLRLHASHAGAPLLGDAHYGGPRRVVLANGRVVSVPRVMLHCARIELPAIDGSPLRIVLPPPADFGTVLRAIGGDEALVAAVIA